MQKNNPAKLKINFRTKITLIILGLFLFLTLLEIGLRLGGFILLSIQEYRNLQSLKQKGSCRIMCLGESTTSGQYPPYLEEILNQHNIGIKFSVIDKGIDAISTAYILDTLESNLDRYQPDIVITMMGINDKQLHMPHEAVSDSKIINFLKSFRTYKLSKLLGLHIVTKLQELKSDKDTAQPMFLAQRDKLQLNPKDNRTYFELGWAYREQGKFPEAEASFKKAIELNPGNDMAYVGLGLAYEGQDKLPEAKASCMKAIELNPENDRAYLELAWFYQRRSKFPEAEPLFKKAIELNPRNDMEYVGLGYAYEGQGKFSEAEAVFKKAIETNIKSDKAYGALKVLYEEMGNSGLARKYDKKYRELKLCCYPAVTIANYHRLKMILDKKGIVYVCVQYPMRNVEPLKNIFQDDMKDIIFVDNERIFEKVLKQENHKNYFTDMFAGDFGHCTEKGNRLLAENIANVILKEIFGK